MAGALAATLVALAAAQQTRAQETDKLAVVWTSGDPDVAHRMCLMYTQAARTQGWFDEVTLIVWGPSQRLLAADKDIQEKVAAMREDGVLVEACIACARSYGLVDRLEALGLPVRPMGEPLSDYLKDDGWQVVSF
jgi:hypothetical protein